MPLRRSALLLSLSIGFSTFAPNAGASSLACSALFSAKEAMRPGDDVLLQLARLKLGAQAANERGEQALARALYARFKAGVTDAKSLGIEIGRMDALLEDERQAADARDAESEKRRTETLEKEKELTLFHEFIDDMPTTGVSMVRFSPDGKLFAFRTSKKYDHTSVEVRETATLALVQELDSKDLAGLKSVGSLEFSSDGNRLIVGMNEARKVTVVDFEIATGRPLRRREYAHLSSGDYPSLYAGWELPNGELNFVTRVWNQLTLHLGRDGKTVKFPAPHAQKSGHYDAHGMIVNPSRTRLIASDDGGKIYIWDLDPENKGLARLFGGRAKPKAIEVESPENTRGFRLDRSGTKLVAWALDEPELRIWDVESGRLLNRLKMPGLKIEAAAFNAAGTELVIGRNDGAMERWSIEPLAQIAVEPTPEEKPETYRHMTVEISPDGEHMLSSVSFSAPLELWRLRGAK